MNTQEITSRSKFALVLSAMRPLTAFLRVGYQKYTTKQTAFNVAMCYNLDNSVIGEYPEYKLDKSKLLLSKGDLKGAINGAAAVENCIKLTWDSDSDSNEDIAMIAILNGAKEEAIFTTNGGLRCAKGQSFNTPEDWKGDTVSVYLAFKSENGKIVSDSSYLGDFTIQPSQNN